MTDQDARLRDSHPYNDTYNSIEIATADRRFEQLLDRRDKLIERSRFGVLALNGSSIVGVLSFYASLHSDFTIDPRFSLPFFGIGMMLGILSIYFETIFLGSRAAHLYGHLSSLRNMRATLDDWKTESNELKFREQIESLVGRSKVDPVQKFGLGVDDKSLPNDFVFSPSALITLNFSGGAWLGGLVIILLGLLT